MNLPVSNDFCPDSPPLGSILFTALDVSLNYLLHHCRVLAPLRDMPQGLLVKHLKAYLSEALDIRMVLATPEPWLSRSGAPTPSAAGGGYEVCLKGWDPHCSQNVQKHAWDNRTIYVVRDLPASL